MKTFKTMLLLMLCITSFFSCEEEEDDVIVEPVPVNEMSIIPNESLDRPNTWLGCVEISSRLTTIQVWDHGLIDTDIISIIANGELIIDNQVLDGPSNPITVDYDFGYNGYNYVTLYAHNLGDVSPNTCTMSINGTEFVLEANLDENGSVDIIVPGFGPSCN